MTPVSWHSLCTQKEQTYCPSRHPFVSFSSFPLKKMYASCLFTAIVGMMLMASFATATGPVQAPAKAASGGFPPLMGRNSGIPHSGTTATSSSSFMPTAFVSKRLPALTIRGGDVAELATLQDVEAAILKASSEQKLVVIDFSATWCGPCKLIAPLVSFLCGHLHCKRTNHMELDLIFLPL